jgi:glycogen synthase
MKVSVVINTYNRIASLRTALKALSFQRYHDLEVVVVDGPSDDGTLDYLSSEWAAKIKICRCAEANLSKSRNVGIRNASGDVICFTDDDGIPEPDWLDQLVIAYEDPNVAAAGGWVRDHTGVDFQTKYIVSTRNSVSEVLIDDPANVPAARPFAEKFPGLIGVNSSFRRGPLLEVGGFDEEYAYFLDETDVLARLVDAGYSVAMAPSAEVHHKYAPSHIRAENGIAKSWLQIMKSTAYYVIKNAPPCTPLSASLGGIEHHKGELHRHTRWFFSEGLIDRQRFDQLSAEIENGAALGITHAFEYPARQLIDDHQTTPWTPLPRKALSQRIRVALVTGLYPPRPCGGVAMFMHTLATSLAELGHEVTVITQADGGRRHTVDFEDGVWVHRIPNDGSVQPAYPEGMPDLPPSIAAFAGRVLAELDRVNAHRDVQCVIGSIWDLEMAAVIASGRYRTAMYLVTSYKLMQDSKPEWSKNAHFFDHHVRKMFDGEAWAIKSCSAVLGSTEAIVSDVSAAYDLTIPSKRTQIIPFGVPKAEAMTTKRGRDPLTLLFVGRLEERKGIDTLLAALPGIMSKIDDLIVDIVGNDSLPDADGVPFRSKFEEANRSANWFSRVRFHGHVDDAQLLEFYRNCSIFVAPSKYESFGLIYLEAMRFAKPCVATRAGGIPEVVVDGTTGILVQPGSSKELEAAILRLASDQDLRKSMGEAGKRRFEQTYTGEQFSNRIIRFVRRAV